MATLNTLAQTLLPEGIYQRLAASDIGRRLARGSFWSLVNALVMKSAALIQAIILARILGITGFGEWGILLSTIAMVGVFASFGLTITTTRHVAQWWVTEPERLGRLLALLQLVASVTGFVMLLVLVFAAKPLATSLLTAPQLSTALAIVGIIVFLNAISSIYSGVLQGLERFRDVAVISSISTIAGVVLSLSLALKYGVSGALVGLALGSLFHAVAFGLQSRRLLRSHGISVAYRRAFTEWSGIANFAVPNGVASAIILVALWVTHVILVRQPSGFDEMGAFQAANQWRTFVIYLPTVMLAALLPVFASLASSNVDKFRQLERRALVFAMLLTALIGFPVMVIAPFLMEIYGEAFRPYYFVLVLLVAQPIFDIGYVVLEKSANACGRAWLLVPANLAMALVVLGLGSWLVRDHLALGLAAALLVGHLVRWLSLWLLLMWARKETITP